MKLTNFDAPVMSSWFSFKGARLDSKPYLSGALEARILLEKLRVEKQPLHEVTTGIYHAGREGRKYVDSPEYGVPFLGSTDILAADLSSLPFLSKKQVEANPLFVLQEAWTLVTRSGTVGRMAFVRPDMVGMACSEHVLRVVPNPDKILPGYLYAYLSSKCGVPQVTEGTYGAIVQHLEPHHIADLPVPRLGDSFELEVHNLVYKSAYLRDSATKILEEAKKRFNWLIEGVLNINSNSPKINTIPSTDIKHRFDAIYHDYAAYQIETRVKESNYTTIGEMCRRVFLPGIFKRIQTEDEMHGAPYYLGESIYWLEPVPKYLLSRKTSLFKDVQLEKGTILIQAFGQRGGLLGHPAFVGEYLDGATTTHMLVRLNTIEPKLTGYLYAYIASLAGYTQITRLAYGGSIPHFDEKGISSIPVPLLDTDEMLLLSEKVLKALEARDEAHKCELRARQLVEDVIIKNSVHGIPL